MWLLVVSLVCWLVISMWSPPKSLAWQKGFRLSCGLTLRKLGLLPLDCSRLLLVSVVGLRLVVIVGTLLSVVLLLLLLFFLARFSLIGGLLLTLRSVLLLTVVGGNVGLRSLFSAPPFWPASWLPAFDESRGSKSVEVQRVWEIYDERLQFMSRQDASVLDESLGRDDVSGAWLVWSRAAESALADAFRFSGGPLPARGLVLGRGRALLRIVQLGGPRVRRARANIADALDAADVFLYCDSSVAHLLDMRRRCKAVIDVLGAMIRYGVSLSRSVELTAQWDQILALGHLSFDRNLGIGALFDAASVVHCRLCDFIHRVVVHRRDEAIREWRNWIREDPLVHPYCWLRPDLVPPAPFLQCEPCLSPDGSDVLSDLVRIDEEFRKAWLPYFCRYGKGRPALTNSALKLMGGCRFYLKFIFPG